MCVCVCVGMLNRLKKTLYENMHFNAKSIRILNSITQHRYC